MGIALNLEIMVCQKPDYGKTLIPKKKIEYPVVFVYQGRYDDLFEYFEINGTKDLHYYPAEGIFKNM